MLERLGESPAFGSLLLDLLGCAGWSIVITGAFAGDGVLVIARRGPFEVRRSGATLADVAVDLFREAALLNRSIEPAPLETPEGQLLLA